LCQALRAWRLLLRHRVPGSNMSVSRRDQTDSNRFRTIGNSILECQRSQAFGAIAIRSPTFGEPLAHGLSAKEVS
jgi:hypothetical protein